VSGIDIPCVQIVELVTDYLDGELDPEQRQLVEEHLADCPPCHRYVEQIRVTMNQLGAVREPDLSPEAWDALRTAFRDSTT
jgi:anti-sigma factor RsiW